MSFIDNRLIEACIRVAPSSEKTARIKRHRTIALIEQILASDVLHLNTDDWSTEEIRALVAVADVVKSIQDATQVSTITGNRTTDRAAQLIGGDGTRSRMRNGIYDTAASVRIRSVTTTGTRRGG